MTGAVKLGLLPFSLIYLLLIIVLAVMKKSKINQMKLLIVASVRMTVQLILVGFVLTYLFEHPHPLFTVAFLAAMIGFSIQRVLSKNKGLNQKFKLAVALSLTFSGLFVLVFFVVLVVREDFFNPQYAIPLAGMIIGNAMTGVTLGLKTFQEGVAAGRQQIEALLNLGAEPKRILLPFVNTALETALLPTIILYQIAIMIAICTSVCLTTFCSLQFGYRTLFNHRSQIQFGNEK